MMRPVDAAHPKTKVSQHDGLHRKGAAINVVSKKEVIRMWDLSGFQLMAYQV